MVTAADFDRDYARRLTLDPQELTAELSALGIGRDGLPPEPVATGQVPEPGQLLPGVSVIIPTYRGAGRSMGALMSLVDQDLDPARFLRIHRSYIVNQSHVRSSRYSGNNEFIFTMANNERIVSGRSYKEQIAKVLQEHSV